MRIAVTRSGGLAGIVRRAEIDSASDPAAARLAAALGIAGEPGPPDSAGPGGGGRHPSAESASRAGAGPPPAREAPAALGADRFVYDIEIEDRVVHVGEADLRGPLRELVDHVLAHGRRSSRPTGE